MILTPQDESRDFFAVLAAKGVTVLTFNCPHCHGENQTTANNTPYDWDTFSSCVSCRRLFMKITLAENGPVMTAKKES
jgi:hypothetical protein